MSLVCTRMSSVVTRLWFYLPIDDAVLCENPVPANVQRLKKLDDYLKRKKAKKTKKEKKLPHLSQAR